MKLNTILFQHSEEDSDDDNSDNNENMDTTENNSTQNPADEFNFDAYDEEGKIYIQHTAASTEALIFFLCFDLKLQIKWQL